MDHLHQWPIRAAQNDELEALAKLWFDGWHDAHSNIVPHELGRLRTLGSFRNRTPHIFLDLRTAGPVGEPQGLAIIDRDELDQLYVGRDARGMGLAACLLSDALGRISASGHRRAWLACAIGNNRAARFYEKNGWMLKCIMKHTLPTTEGPFDLDVWRYEIPL